MCEWLACREWCDVQLHCGGRTFNAHRAVLASVSHFLKGIFLSCTSEEGPMFIVLPDFDFEAMSSVLYYVYNGEVLICKQKLDMFLDITKAMQIFVDEKSLPKSDVTAKDVTVALPESVSKEYAVQAKYGDQPYIYIKNQQKHDSAVDLRDKHAARARFWNLNKQCNPRLGNPQLPYGGRQSNSYLRDLFIETYPWNCNANGRAPSVPAIPNEHYHRLTSAFLTNANCKHPSAAWNTISDVPKTCGHHLGKFQRPNLNINESFKESCQNITNDYDLQPLTAIRGADMCQSSYLQEKHQFPPMAQSFYGLKTKSYSVVKISDNLCKNMKNHYSKPRISMPKNMSTETVSSGSTKGATILNKVLDSPWYHHAPNGYKPSCRRVTFSASISAPVDKPSDEKGISDKKVPVIEENDSNNNVQESPGTNELTKDMFSMETKEPSKASHPADCIDLKCAICSQEFTSSEALRSHAKRHSTTSRYTCNECSKSFSQLRNFKYHMSVHRGTREFAATCTVCGKYFNDRGYLSSHMKIHRNRKEYKCSQCPKSFNQRVAYNMHVRIHTGVKPHVCDECGKAFSRKMLLKQHQRTHSGERPYACAHCEKRFADRSNMTLHLRLHSGVKPFSCSLCPKSFTKKHHLKSHLNFHTGAKPYSCPRCKLAFTQSSNMRTHYKKCKASEVTESEVGSVSSRS